MAATKLLQPEQRLRAQYAVSRILAEAATLLEAAPKILQAVGEALGWDFGTVWSVEPGSLELRCAELWRAATPSLAEFETDTRKSRFTKGAGLPGRVWETGKAVWISDVSRDGNFSRAATAAKAGLHAAIAFPIRLQQEILVIEFFSREICEPDEATLQMAETIGSHIAQFKHAEDDGRSGEEEFRAMFELAGSGKCQTDPASGRFLRVNRKLCEITGYTEAELLGMTFPQITFAPDRQKDLEQFQRLVRGECSEYTIEKRYLRKDGKMIWVHVSTALILDTQGQPSRTVGVVQDIDLRKRAEEGLHQSEERYRLILENALEYAILTLDREGRVTTWNSGAQHILGHAEQEIVGKSLDVIFTPEDAKNGQLELEMRRALSHGRAQDERWHLRKDGNQFWASGLMMPLKDEDGQHLGFLKILRDRTAHKQGEEALRDSEARFRQLADSMPQIIWGARADGSGDYFNKRWYDFTGYSVGMVKAGSWRNVFHPDDAERCTVAWRHAMESGQPYEAECRLLDRNAVAYRWFLARALPVRNDAGEIVRWFGTCTDIDEKKRTEERFVRLNETLVSVMGAIPDIVFVTGVDGKIEFRNPAGSQFTRSVTLNHHLPAPIQAELERVVQTGEDHLPTTFKTVHRFVIQNVERHFLARILGMRTPDRKIFGAVVMVQDVTEFRLLDEVKTNLIATVSHELKTPITSLRTALMLMDQTRGTLTPKQAEMLGIAQAEAERLLRTLNSLLDLTRFEDNALGMRLETLSPEDLVLAAVEETRAVAAIADAQVKVKVQPLLPGLAVDRERILHVLTNFLTNAIKYSPSGGEILVQARQHEEGVYFSVSDGGPGVPRQYHSRIFERFFRVPGTAKTGAGLGLSIARDFVRVHSGRIGVHSEPGKGSEFYFVLPDATPS